MRDSMKTALEQTWFGRRTAGADSFQESGRGSNPKSIFNDLVQDAKYEYGSGGYTGTLAEKGGAGFKIMSQTPMSSQAAREFIADTIDRADKWGPAFAIPYGREKVMGSKEYTVRVQAKNRRSAQQAGKEAITAKGRVRQGAQVQVVKMSIEMTRPGGTAKTGFVAAKEIWFESKGGQHGTRKEALAAANKVMTEDSSYDVGDTILIHRHEFLGYVKKEEDATRLATWTVTGTRQQVAVGKIEGWIFYGLASS
jgi:hypothetical protein